MKRVTIKIIRTCNNDCIFCIDKNDRYRQEPPIEKIKEQISISAKKGCQCLDISGGEPLISKNFFDLLNFARQKGIKTITVQTNGRMLYYENLVKKLKQFGSIKFFISFHFPNANLYKKYCQADGFYQVVAGIKNLIKYDFEFSVNIIMMKPNLLYLKGMVDFLKNLGVKKMGLSFIIGRSVLDNYKEFVPRFSECLKIVKELIKENPNLEIRGIPPCILGEKFKKNLAPCFNPEKIPLSLEKKPQPVSVQVQVYKNRFFAPKCCNSCRYKSVCLGIPKEYYQIYGAKEIKPII